MDQLSTPPLMPPPAVSSDDKLFIICCHLSPLLGVGLIVPLIIYLIKKDQSEEVAFHAKEALNFHISTLLYSLACAATCVGIPLIAVIGVAALVLMIIATIKAADGERYHYPLTIRLVR